MLREKLLSIPFFYNLLQDLTESKDGISKYFEYFTYKEGDHILDIGCGTGTAAKRFKGAIYTGFDLNEKYIIKAQNEHAKEPNISFQCSDINDSQYLKKYHNYYDIVMMNGVMHHLSDLELEVCLKSISQILKPNGRFYSIDGVYVEHQKKMAKLLLKGDRGKYVRTEAEYVALVNKYLPNEKHCIREDINRIPYTHIIFY